MKTILRGIILSLLCHTSWASTLEDFAPQQPLGSPWSDAWYYYIHDPELGYFKIVFLSYLNSDTEDGEQHGYLHLIFTPKQGEQRIYEQHYEHIKISALPEKAPWGFRFEIPGAAVIEHDNIELTLPGLKFSAQFSDQHRHYSSGDNPGASPFGWLTSLPFVQNEWFVFSMGTQASYDFQDKDTQHSGTGLSYIDRGWNTGQATGMIYLMAVSDELSYMFAAGADGGLPIETWAGRLISDNTDFTFGPSLRGLATSSDIDVCAGSAVVEMRGDDYRVSVRAQAPLNSFYNHSTPSLKVFEQKNPVMKSMSATASVEIYQNDSLLESFEVDQSILEFGGSYYCDALHPDR